MRQSPLIAVSELGLAKSIEKMSSPSSINNPRWNGLVGEAKQIFKEMEIGEGANQVLDKARLQTMVEQLCNSGLIFKAYRLLMQLADSGVVPA
ncbi:hypothetical protein CMV_006228 [Castanea mollissima]|uniref:Uncharacterized protein n=1 Tax=Castanea mollissima TaxID=60419 RepID=A0A8J4RHH3_9ROSI|nr:hypothetical protein CMV_006228 [Castanea mollissima]